MAPAGSSVFSPRPGWGDFREIPVGTTSLVAHRCDWQGNSMLALDDLSYDACEVRLDSGIAPRRSRPMFSPEGMPATPVHRAVRTIYGEWRWSTIPDEPARQL
jgi:hypothetical protein